VVYSGSRARTRASFMNHWEEEEEEEGVRPLLGTGRVKGGKVSQTSSVRIEPKTIELI
jgi:hypothetical protein